MQRLSRHFSWPEFCDERQCFHQEFVYDVTMFAADHGFPWSDVVRSAVIAKGIFPRLEGESDLEVTIKDLKSGADGETQSAACI